MSLRQAGLVWLAVASRLIVLVLRCDATKISRCQMLTLIDLLFSLVLLQFS